MKILNPAVEAAIRSGHGLRLNLGCGTRQMPGYFGVDHLPLPGVDVVADLNEPLDLLPANSVVTVFCRHTLEHVTNFLPLVAELHRVCRPDAELEIIVPHFSNPYGYSDPTHVRFFGLYSFFYFADESDQPRRKVPSFYSSARFRVEQVRLTLLKHSLVERIAKVVLQPLVNRGIAWQDWYERRMCRWLPVSEIHYRLRPVKAASVARAA